MSVHRGVIAAALLLATCAWGNAAYIAAKAWLAQGLVYRAWQSTLASAELGHKPWPWADTWPVAVLRHPFSRDYLYVLEGGFGSSLAFGPGHIVATAMPGEDDTSVVAGHRDTHFAFLQHLQLGTKLELQDAHGQWHDYVVAATHVVDSREGDWLVPGGAQLHLITCYPFDALLPGGPLRYVVVAERIAPIERHSEQTLAGLNASAKNRHNRRL